jgi:hypothetical protein
VSIVGIERTEFEQIDIFCRPISAIVGPTSPFPSRRMPDFRDVENLSICTAAERESMQLTSGQELAKGHVPR